MHTDRDGDARSRIWCDWWLVWCVQSCNGHGSKVVTLGNRITTPPARCWAPRRWGTPPRSLGKLPNRSQMSKVVPSCPMEINNRANASQMKQGKKVDGRIAKNLLLGEVKEGKAPNCCLGSLVDAQCQAPTAGTRHGKRGKRETDALWAELLEQGMITNQEQPNKYPCYRIRDTQSL